LTLQSVIEGLDLGVLGYWITGISG